jgi:hypothetical protein
MLRNIWPILVAAAISVMPASACRTYDASVDVSIFHDQVPGDLVPEMFVAEVEFEHPELGWRGLQVGARAKIKRTIQGDYSGSEVIVRDSAVVRISCYNPYRKKTSGTIVGRSNGYEGGVLVLEPVFASAENGYDAKGQQ